MRCRFCGSKSLHEDTQHKTFSTGKAVAGAVVFGVYGAAAGFIGKDKKGYRCGACGQFMDAPMDFFTEGQIDTAIREAESGRSRTMFDYYHNQYANIQANIPAALPTSASAPAQEIIYQPMIAAPAGTALKRSYRYGLWEPDCPIWVEGVILKTAEDGDKLSLAAWNLGKETVRSVYFLVKVFDDTGDPVSECRCVYQGLSIPRGGQLPEEKEFSLNTDLAYRVELTCEKAALEGDAVWRQEANAKEHSLPEQPELSEENFPRLKYANPKYSALKTDRDHYKMPIQADGFWLCCCGTPVQDGQQCPRCGDTWEHVELCFSQPYLMERQQKAVRERAAKRASDLDRRLQQVKEERQKAVYAEARKLQSKGKPADLRAAAAKYGEISGWRDTDEQAKACLMQANEIEERERAEEAARQEREAQEAAERKGKTKKIVMIVTPIVIACIAFLIVLSKVIIPNVYYNKALALKNSGDYESAITMFEKMDAYKDSSTQIAECENEIINIKYETAQSLINEGKYESAYEILIELGDEESIAKAERERIWDQLDDEVRNGLINAEIGDIITFGAYEQDCNYLNGPEPIEWHVLAKEDGRILVISVYALDCVQYETPSRKSTWEYCNLRKWLNNAFLNDAFSSDEQFFIPSVTVKADSYPEHPEMDAGNDTKDKIFLLSYNEVINYFASDNDRTCTPTEYAMQNGTDAFDISIFEESYRTAGRTAELYAMYAEDGHCRWPLRTPAPWPTYVDGEYTDKYTEGQSELISQVQYDGSIGSGNVDNKDIGVRPAMWIDVEP